MMASVWFPETWNMHPLTTQQACKQEHQSWRNVDSKFGKTMSASFSGEINMSSIDVTLPVDVRQRITTVHIFIIHVPFLCLNI